MANTVVFTILILTLVGMLLSLVLYWVANRFKVEEDARIDDVEKAMPGANCGGCGFAGCRAFAEATVKASDLDNLFCPVGGNEVMQNVAKILGREVKAQAKQIAVLRCNGTCENRPRTNLYDGIQTCRSKAALYSGDTGCSYGCLGCGDCVNACDFDAIHMNPLTGLPEVDEEKCTACGGCVKACPKSLIELRNKGPKGRRIFVSCVNEDKGGAARKACSAACIGCSKCFEVCAFEAITIKNNLSYIDYLKCRMCRKCVSVCPTHAIHELNFPAPKPKPAVAAAGGEAPANSETKTVRKEEKNVS